MKGVFQTIKGQCFFIQETKVEVIDVQVFRSICPWPGGSFVMSPWFKKMAIMKWQQPMPLHYFQYNCNNGHGLKKK